MSLNRSFLRAFLAMVGTIIGAGVFGLPAAFVRLGFVPASLLFLALALVVTATHLILAEQLLATRERQRLAGLARRGLGEFAYHVTSVTYPLGIIASNYAYLILGGEFLAILSRGFGFAFPVAIWQFIFWIAVAVTIGIGIKAMTAVDAWLVPLKILVLIVAVLLAAPFVDVQQTTTAVWANWHLPFGIFLFTLSGVTAVGEAVELSGRKRKTAFTAVVSGSLVSAFLSWLFGATIFLAAAGFPIRDAADIASVFPSALWWVVPLLGFLAVATAYVTTANDLRSTFQFDQKWKPWVAKGVAIFSPLILLAVLSRDFLSAIGFIGAILIGVNSLTIAALGYKAMLRQRNHFLHIVGTAVCALLIGVYTFGIVQQIFTRTSL
jgi:tyrosine-specific transport protein